MIKLDCVKATEVGLEDGWAIINTHNGGIVAHSTNVDDCGPAWMLAAEALAEALSDIQLTVQAVAPQRCFFKSRKFWEDQAKKVREEAN